MSKYELTFITHLFCFVVAIIFWPANLLMGASYWVIGFNLFVLCWTAFWGTVTIIDLLRGENDDNKL